MNSKKRKLLPPYENYFSTGPQIHSKNERYILTLLNQAGKTVSSTSYARYLMSIKIGRLLHKLNEQVDHIDGDPTNNTYENLQIITREENLQKYTNTICGRILKFNCAHCEKEITRKDDFKDYTKTFKTCSRRCAIECLKELKYVTREILIARNKTILIEAVKPVIVKKHIFVDFESVSLPT